ncbi:hypothetical protein EDC96DRAFT_503167, partial [Choanephora cucurbitarum]
MFGQHKTWSKKKGSMAPQDFIQRASGNVRSVDRPLTFSEEHREFMVDNVLEVMNRHEGFYGYCLKMDNVPMYKHQDMQNLIESRGYKCIYLQL